MEIESEAWGKLNQSTKIVYLAFSEAKLFCDIHGIPHVQIPVKDRLEIWPSRSGPFRRWLAGRMFEVDQTVVTSSSISSALNVIDHQAQAEGERVELFNRVATYQKAFYYDLTDENWRVIRIDKEGWRIQGDPPLLFNRHGHQAPQVEPKKGGEIRALFKYLSVRDPEAQLLLLVWMVSCFIPAIPHPVLVLYGSQGSGKSTVFRFLRRIIDPSSLDTLTFPEEKKELIQNLSHHWTTLFDNVDKLSPSQSDLLCRGVTGEGFSKRELYTDDEDIVYRYRRCIGLNGINVAATRPDLLDRSILLRLERIAPEDRSEESELEEAFQKDRASILGGALDALSKAMQIRPTLKMTGLPRMADFARWGCAIAQALGSTSEEFLRAYAANMEDQNDEVLAGTPVASAVVALMKDRSEWKGTARELLAALEPIAEELRLDQKPSSWPKAPNALSRRINEVEPNLAQAGIVYERKKSGDRTMSFKKAAGNIAQTAQGDGKDS